MTLMPGHLAVNVWGIFDQYGLLAGHLDDVPEGHFPMWFHRLDILLPAGYPTVRESSSNPETPASVPAVGPVAHGSAPATRTFVQSTHRSNGWRVVVSRECATGYDAETRQWITACSSSCVCEVDPKRRTV